jgi:hypothetical protein
LLLRARRIEQAKDALACGVSLAADAYVFSHEPDGSKPIRPDGVSHRFATLADRVGVDCWLHDVGYAPRLQRTGLHQLDGAWWLRAIDWRLACLVAQHSEARFEVNLRGHGEELAEYPREESPTTDALTYCDLTTGPTGLQMTLDERIAEVEARVGQGEIVEALRQARPHLAAAIARTEERLQANAS